MTTQIETPKTKTFFIDETHKQLLHTLDQLSKSGEPCNLIIEGLTGCGKSEMATQFAAHYDRPLAVIEVGILSESKDIFGQVNMTEGTTHYTPGLFTNAIQTPGCVVHLQELNRPESDKALNAIFSVLDPNIRGIWIDELSKYVKVAPNVMFFATLNEGSDYVGVMPLDAALRDRFSYRMSLGYLPQNLELSLVQLQTKLDESMAFELIAVLDSLRNNIQEPTHISTRQAISIATLIKTGLPLRDALFSTVNIGPSELEKVLLSLSLLGKDTDMRTKVGKFVIMEKPEKSIEDSVTILENAVEDLVNDLKVDDAVSRTDWTPPRTYMRPRGRFA